jgi:DNA modification methylase
MTHAADGPPSPTPATAKTRRKPPAQPTVRAMPGPPTNITVHHGDSRDILPTIPSGTFHAVVTDPPYELGMMGKAWDRTGVAFDTTLWTECLRTLKPGGHLVVFGHPRTWHRVTCAIEDAGAEIRDPIAWLYSGGMPKAKGVLKPAFEPVLIARKPLAGTQTANVAAHGVGALNVESNRIPYRDDADLAEAMKKNPGRSDTFTSGTYGANRPQQHVNPAGRWPTNVVVDQDVADEIDAFTGQANSRFLPAFRWQAKAPSTERPNVNGVTHPTVKPLDLMRWLVRLVTPPGGVVLDPFGGSGTTAEACLLEGAHCWTIEQEEKYLPLINARVQRGQLALDIA